jgi:mRNA-degrading endonuclease RelE of RelBE toxin-antitoxin system
MSYKVEAIPNFKKEAKRLVKKFRSLKQELAELAVLLEKEPFTGTPLGYDCYKIRLSIESKQKGKSGGARIVTYVYVEKTTVYLLTIFDKGESENITDKQLKALVEAARAL